MIRWTGLAPWEFEFPPGSLTSTFLVTATPPNQTVKSMITPNVRALYAPNLHVKKTNVPDQSIFVPSSRNVVRSAPSRETIWVTGVPRS